MTSLFKLKGGWRMMVIVGILFWSFTNARSEMSGNTLKVETAEDDYAPEKKETSPQSQKSLEDEESVSSSPQRDEKGPSPQQTKMEQEYYDSSEHSTRGDEHHKEGNDNKNRNNLEEEDEFDDRTLLDTFGEAAKEYLTQRVIPDTDADCKWDWRYTRCEPFCECHLQPKFGDFHLGRSCRYRSSDTTNSAPPPNFNRETCHLPPETPYVRFAVKALRQTRQASHKAQTVVHNSYQNGKFKVETLKTNACQHMICPSSSSSNNNDHAQHFYRKPSSWKEKFICGSTPPASICDGEDMNEHDSPLQNNNTHNRSTSSHSAESSFSQEEHHHHEDSSHPPDDSSTDTNSARNHKDGKATIPPPPSIKTNSIPLSDQSNNGPSVSSSSSSEPNTAKRKSWLWK